MVQSLNIFMNSSLGSILRCSEALSHFTGENYVLRANSSLETSKLFDRDNLAHIFYFIFYFFNAQRKIRQLNTDGYFDRSYSE